MALLYWVAFAEVYIFQAQSWGITLRGELLWFYGSDNIGQCPFRFYGDLTSRNADGQLNVTFFYEQKYVKTYVFSIRVSP